VATGWEYQSEEPPFSIEPGETRTLEVSTQGDGAGIMVIMSNDPDEPEKHIELFSTADRPPLAEFTAPHNGAVLPVEGGLISALITDDQDPNDTVEVEIRSSVDGILVQEFPNPHGDIDLEFYSDTPGDHDIHLVATDSCGNETTIDTAVCQQYGYEVDSLDISTWHFEGEAEWDPVNEWVQLTPVEKYVVGTAFSTSTTIDGGSVEIEFLFYIGDGTGADGISLTALDVDRMTDFIGGDGCGIGYGGDANCTDGPPLPGWSIEVDTYYNGGHDPTYADHVAFTFDGDVDAPLAWAELPEMEDTGWHQMRVVVTDPHVLVEIDGIPYIDEDIPGYYGFSSYVGFTAGTGGATNTHLIDSLVVTELVCEEE